MTDKKINILNETDLSQVAGGTHAESVADDDYTAFYKRVGVTRIEKNFFDHNIYSWQGKQYESRDALFAALDKAGIHAKKVTRRLHTVYNPQPHTFYE